MEHENSFFHAGLRRASHIDVLNRIRNLLKGKHVVVDDTSHVAHQETGTEKSRPEGSGTSEKTVAKSLSCIAVHRCILTHGKRWCEQKTVLRFDC